MTSTANILMVQINLGMFLVLALDQRVCVGCARGECKYWSPTDRMHGMPILLELTM